MTFFFFHFLKKQHRHSYEYVFFMKVRYLYRIGFVSRLEKRVYPKKIFNI